jgi:hypothetical protein
MESITLSEALNLTYSTQTGGWILGAELDRLATKIMNGIDTGTIDANTGKHPKNIESVEKIATTLSKKLGKIVAASELLNGTPARYVMNKAKLSQNDWHMTATEWRAVFSQVEADAMGHRRSGVYAIAIDEAECRTITPYIGQLVALSEASKVMKKAKLAAHMEKTWLNLAEAGQVDLWWPYAGTVSDISENFAAFSFTGYFLADENVLQSLKMGLPPAPSSTYRACNGQSYQVENVQLIEASILRVTKSDLSLTIKKIQSEKIKIKPLKRKQFDLHIESIDQALTILNVVEIDSRRKGRGHIGTLGLLLSRRNELLPNMSDSTLRATWGYFLKHWEASGREIRS